jgi:hypothetical protein
VPVLQNTVPQSTVHQSAAHPEPAQHHPAFHHTQPAAAEHVHSAPIAASVPAQPHVQLVAAEHHTHSTVTAQPIHSSVVVPPTVHHAEHTHHTQPSVAPAAPSAARAEASRLLVTAGAAVKNRFSRQGGRVSVVGTVLLSVLISSGLFSLQLISKWRRPKPTETVTKADSLDQPLTIASAEDASQTPNERADSPADLPEVASKGTHGAQHASHSEESDQRGLDDFFANSKKDTVSHAAVTQATGSRAPYSPEPVDANGASSSPADTRTVMAPEAASDRGLPPSEQLVPPPVSQADALPSAPPSPAVSQNISIAPGPQISPIYRPSNLPSTVSPARSLETAARTSQQLPGASPAMNVADWNRTAPPGAPAAAAIPTAVSPAPGSSLDAPGPVITPGRLAGVDPTATGAPAPAVVPTAATADPASQLRDLSQPAAPVPAQTAGAVPPPAIAPPTTASPYGVDPVTGLLNRNAASTPEAAHPEFSAALASLDRTKVMSFQFRNAPWTVVLSQFAAETHLELRMQVVPQGVFNRWDAARYSPSQTLAILNSEIARAGCQLKLEGSVLRVVKLSQATAQASPTLSTPQTSGILPVSGRY